MNVEHLTARPGRQAHAEHRAEHRKLWSALLIGMAGIYATVPATMLPALVSDWVSRFGVNDDTAGFIGAGGLLGHTCGLLLALRLMSRWPLPRVALLGLGVGATGDVLSMIALDAVTLGGARAMNGIGLGVLLGATVNWLGRHPQAERGFGVFTMLQFVVPAGILVVVPTLWPIVGHCAIYLCVLVLAAIAVVFNRLFALNGGDQPIASTRGAVQSSRHATLMAMSVLSLALFNVAAMGIWAFVVRYAESGGLTTADATRAVAYSNIFGVLGSLLVVAIGTRFGRARTTLLALLFFVATVLAFAVLSASTLVFHLQLSALNFAWAFLVPYIQATQSALDSTGKLPVWGMVAASCGASAGPALIGAVSQLHTFRAGFAVATVAAALCAGALLPPLLAVGRARQSTAR